MNIEKIGEIDGISIYYDECHTQDNFMIGRKEGKINYLIGNTKDLDSYKCCLNKIKSTPIKLERDNKIDEILN